MLHFHIQEDSNFASVWIFGGVWSLLEPAPQPHSYPGHWFAEENGGIYLSVCFFILYFSDTIFIVCRIVPPNFLHFPVQVIST